MGAVLEGRNVGRRRRCVLVGRSEVELDGPAGRGQLGEVPDLVQDTVYDDIGENAVRCGCVCGVRDVWRCRSVVSGSYVMNHTEVAGTTSPPAMCARRHIHTHTHTRARTHIETHTIPRKPSAYTDDVVRLSHIPDEYVRELEELFTEPKASILDDSILVGGEESERT